MVELGVLLATDPAQARELFERAAEADNRRTEGL